MEILSVSGLCDQRKVFDLRNLDPSDLRPLLKNQPCQLYGDTKQAYLTECVCISCCPAGAPAEQSAVSTTIVDNQNQLTQADLSKNNQTGDPSCSRCRTSSNRSGCVMAHSIFRD